jgi:dihydroneopterin aldolase
VNDAGERDLCISVRGLRVLGVHGALPEERQRLQPFELDLDLFGEFAGAATSDRLADTADYGVLAERAAAVVSTTTCTLLEALARSIGEDLLATEPRLAAVAVTVRKLQPPLPLDVGSVGVRLVVRRD